MKEGWKTLVDALRWQAEHIGEQVVFTFLSGAQEERLTFAELDARARAIALKLQRQCEPGDRAMLVYPVGLRYIEAFFGCLYAGVIAVPAYPPHPNHASRGLSKFQGIVVDSRPAVILSVDKLQRMLIGLREDLRELQVPWITTAGEAEPADAWVAPQICGDDLAFLQYTSGSTAEPKGVMVRHSNLLANLELIMGAAPRKPGELLVSWLPPYHDMGLIGSILLPVYGGGPAVLMPPASFLQRPLWWLETIARFRGTYGAAPDFAYELCVRAAEQGLPKDLDLSSWTTFMDGAEPVRASTLASFHRVFGPAGVPPNGIVPSYGLAEATLLVAMNDPAIGRVEVELDPRQLEAKRAVRCEDGRGKRLVSCGQFDAAAWDLRIVDPEQRRVLPEGEIGEIWLRGPCVAAGYWGKPALSQETFEARLASAGEERFLRTGDMGFVLDHQLYVSGRLKEMICIRGRNLYPHDIERAVEPLSAATPTLRGACVAVGVEIADQEQVVLFHEIERRSGQRRKLRDAPAPAQERRRSGDRRSRRNEVRPGPAQAGRAEDEIALSLAGEVSQEFAVRIAAVVLVAPGTLPRTSSGKARRFACRASFMADFTDGALRVLHVWRSQALAPSPGPQRLDLPLQDQAIAYERSERSHRELVDWLTGRFAAKLAVEPEAIDPVRPFVEFGLDSSIAVEIAAQLSEFVGQSLSATLFWDQPNIDSLASALARDRQSTPEAAPTDRGSVDGFAIVGIACKLPGADDLEAFWDLLREGRSGISEGALQRFSELGAERDLEALRVPPHGGFIRDIDRFDAGFFSISAREAAEMDPQQRLLLEVGFHALEDSGIAPSAYAGSRTGVFLGISSSDYGMMVSRQGSVTDLYSGTGNAHSIAANRFSYAFDLRGPSLALDTACSSSLLAVHLGCESLRRGESDAVVVAGVNAILSPHVTSAFFKAQMLALDGRCKTFAADADGYVRGEGCAALVLKRLGDARRDGDRIRALIRGSAVNQDGRSNGLTAPNGNAQRGVVRSALANARLQREDIDYIEAHGTGTALGDPIEVAALGAELASPARELPWLLGAVKANIGHLEAAAGVAGLTKLVLCLERETIPAQIHLAEVNPRIDLEAIGARIPRENVAWPRAQRVRRAGVSSFGFGGTNVHVIVEEAPARAAAAPAPTAPTPLLLALSARSERSLRRLSAALAAQLQPLEASEFARACLAASATRSEFPQRLALLARSPQSVAAELSAYAGGVPSPRVHSRLARKPSRIAFLFTGQGAQYPGMGRELYATEAVFREAIEHCAELLKGVMPLVPLLTDETLDPLRLADTRVTQPLLFSFQYALAALWREWGIEPDAVLGHSLGEYAAFACAGALDLAQALELVVTRAELIARLPEGAMAVVLASDKQLAGALSAGSGRVSIAAFNGPANFALSGPSQDVDAVVEQLARSGVGVRRLEVSHAFHSPLIEPMLPEFAAALESCRFLPARAQIISNVSGSPVDFASISGHYWSEHTRKPVQFAAGVRSLLESGVRQLIEIGPQPVLSNLAKRLAGDDVEILPSLRRGAPARETLLEALAALHVSGHAPRWKAVHHGRATASLPAYPFDRERHWAAARAVEAALGSAAAVDPRVLHPLLDGLIERSPTRSLFEKRFDRADCVIGQHVVESIPILPGVAFVEAMLAAARLHLGRPVLQLENVIVVSPLALDADGRAHMLVEARSASSPAQPVQLSVSSRRPDGSLIEHASCECGVAPSGPAPALDLAALQTQPAARLDAAWMYGAFQRVGIEYGEFFRGLRWVARGQRESFAELQLTASAAAVSGYVLHPALLDAALQSFAALISDSQDVTQLYVPLAIERVELHAALGTRVFVHALRTDAGTSASLPELVRGSLRIADERGDVLLSVHDFSLKRVRRERTIAEMIRSQTEAASPARLSPALQAELFDEQARLRALFAIESYAAVGPIVDGLCTRYVIDALAQLGCPAQRAAPLDAAALAARCGLSAPHRKLLDRMLQMLEQDGACTRLDSGELIWAEDDTRARPPSVDELLRRSPACSGELALLRRCGENLSQALRGEVTPLELLFPDGSLRLTEALYQESPFARYFNGMLQAALRRVVAAAGERPLRVLEIGAGTGGTTAYALQVLAGADVHYVFSDVSRLFLTLAQKKFRGYSALEYALLDIEKPPAEQGFEQAGFDLVIAANVLHATFDVGLSLEHARWLLRPNGALLLLEGTGRQRATDLIFGLTDGWWRFQDERSTAGYPLLARSRWVELLLESGFAGAVPVNHEDEATAWCQQLVIVAHADSHRRDVSRVATLPAPIEKAQRLAEPGAIPAAHELVAHTRGLIVAELAAALRTAPDTVDVEQNFLDMGLDSLMAMEILGKLKARWGVSISPTVLFEHTTTLALAEYLARRHGDRLLSTPHTWLPSPHVEPTPAPALQPPAAGISVRRDADADGAIAVIGMACRFPGAADLAEFWRLLVEGRDMIGEIPPERWDTARSGGCKYAGVLERIDQFDPQFFEISPREARLIDPQQRLFLEVAWEALEHAGSIAPGTDTGVFVGCTNSDYFDRIKPYLTLDDYAAGLGNKNCIIPNRVSYALNLRGPSLLVDTACSSSLVALHMALQSLRRGECSAALVGGVNVLLSPLYYLALNRMGVQARDGRCKAFDHRADGFASGEGAGAVLLKPLARALADGDHVYAIVRGSAVNHGGRSAGLAAPNPAAHAELIASAYRDAAVSPDTLSYIEAHGTGTAIGDPIEIDGLTRAFSQWTQRKAFCAIGSVKTNIGHLEPAAGIAGVIKTLLSLQHRYLPPSLHFERPNPHIAFEATPFVVQAAGGPWEHVGPLRAGVSSFGMGGTNAHVVLEEGPRESARAAETARVWLLALSARTAPALRALVARYAAHCSAAGDLSLNDVCFTAAAGRVAMKHRLGIIAGDRAELQRALKRLTEDSAWTSLDAGLAACGTGKPASDPGSVGIAHTTRADAERAAALYARGATLRIDPALAARKTALPTYPFERMRCWVDEPAAASVRPVVPRVHPFLQKRIRDTVAELDEGAEPAS